MPKTRRNPKKCGGGSNLIAAMNPPQSYTGGPPQSYIGGPPQSYIGGKRRSVKKGGDLATIAVPAVLIAANQLYKPKKHLRDIKKGGADLADFSKIVANAQQPGGAFATPTPTPQHQTVNVTQLPNVTAGIAKVVGGNGEVLLEQPAQPLDQSGDQLVVGSGILTDIAAPAVLIAANHLYNPKRRQSKKNKRRTSRKSRRV